MIFPYKGPLCIKTIIKLTVLITRYGKFSSHFEFLF